MTSFKSKSQTSDPNPLASAVKCSGSGGCACKARKISWSIDETVWVERGLSEHGVK